MNQEKSSEQFGSQNIAADVSEENLNADETNSAGKAGSPEIENLPVESIGSYARLGEELTGEDTEETDNSSTESRT
jgi:hypothetical protein